MKKIITLLIIVLLFPNVIFSQTTIWEEDFTYPDFTTVGTANRWTITTSGVPNYFEVRSNEFRANDTNAQEQIFSTEVINTSAYSNVVLSADAFKPGGTMESGDYVNFYYKLDGGAEISFGTNGTNLAEFGSVTASQTGLNGSTIQIIIRVQNGTGNAEIYGFDNILVEGTLSVAEPEIDIIGNGTSILNGDITPSLTDYTDFGTIDLATVKNRTFSIQNTGSLTLNLTGGSPLVAISGDSEFTISVQPTASSILSGGSDLTFDVLFTPTVEGNKTAIVSIENNDADEDPYTFTVLANAQQSFFDSDGDGIFDNVDIDDDNDGILDADEETSCRSSSSSSSASYKFLNESFGTGSRTTINTTYDATTTYCYEDGIEGSTCSTDVGYSMNDGEYTVGSSAQIATWAADQWWLGADHTGDTDGRMALFNADYVPGVFYTATIKGALPNIPITYSFWVLNLIRTDGTAGQLKPDIRVEFRDGDDNVLTNITTGLPAVITTGDIPESVTGDSNSWYQFTADLILNANEFYVYFINNQVGGMGNDLAIDDIVISQTLCDMDSDGVADVFDLDSDNDGIPDIVENGNSFYSLGTAKVPYPSGWVDVNLNGMHDALEGNTSIDSDGDGTPNYLDLDSDNDAIFDVDESGAGNINAVAGFENGDGDINGDGVGDGLDTDAFRETDINSDNILEYFTDGILDIYDCFIGSTFATSYGNINQGSETLYVLDSDSDGIPDYLDISSNGSTFDISTTLYASLDVNNDGIIDGSIDIEGDGILDAFDTDNTVFGSPRDLNQKLQLYFDGRNDYVEDDATVLSGLSEATLMGWIKIDPTAIGDQIVLGQNNYYLQLMSDKKIKVVAGGNNLSTSTALNTNQWIHIATTYSNSNSKLKLYINGEIIDSTAVSGALSVDTSLFTLGRKPITNSNYYKGYLDEVRVFNKALSEDELHKMIYQEIEDNLGTVKGVIIPRDITNYINSTTITPLDWTYLKRYYRLDLYKDDIADDLTTSTIDVGSGAKMYNIKLINTQSAPLPFITKQSGSLPTALDIPADGVVGNDALTYDWSIVKIEHADVNYNANQKHLGLFVNQQDVSLNPIEFSIQNDSELNISWYLKLDGFIDLDDESQLVQGGDSMLDEDSIGYIEKDQQGTANSFNYNYWSSSVGPIGAGSNNSNYAISGVLEDGTNAAIPNENGAINFQPAYAAADTGVTSPIILSSYWLFTFNGTSGDYNSWVSIDENTPIKVGDGYTMKGTSGNLPITTDQNYVFKGKPNNGDITLPISVGNNRLIGNPYASAIDADEFIKDNIKESDGGSVGNTLNVFNGALYFWHHFGEENSHNLAEYVGGYATYTLIGGTEAISNDILINNDMSLGGKEPERYIPVGQGFFVNAYLPSSIVGTTTTVDGGDIIFKNSQRIFKTEISNGGNGSVFFKSGAIKNRSLVENSIDTREKIRLVFDSSTGYHRQLLIGVDENTSIGFDIGYDAPIADINKEDMYWTFDGAKFVIQGVPNFETDQELPLGIIVSEASEIKIQIDTLENVDENTTLYIKDNLNGETYDITYNSFEINLEEGEYLDRFSLTFQPSVLALEDVKLAEGIFIYMNNHIAELQVKRIVDTEIIGISVLNLVGQTVESWKGNFNEREFSIPLTKPPGVYIVSLITTNGFVNKKIIIE